MKAFEDICFRSYMIFRITEILVVEARATAQSSNRPVSVDSSPTSFSHAEKTLRKHHRVRPSNERSSNLFILIFAC